MRTLLLVLGLLASVAAFAGQPVQCGDQYPDTEGLLSPEELEQALGAKASKDVVISEASRTPRFARPAFVGFPKSQTHVDWVTVKRLVLLGAVAEIFQTHSRTVIVVTRTGRILDTTEPQLDDVVHVARVVDPCAVFIHIATE